MNATIYYFTGTGNSLKIAKDLKNELNDAQIVQICKNNMGTPNTDSDKIGVVFPVYFRGLPMMVKKFVENLQINHEVYIFSVATYGGGAGISFEQLREILTAKGGMLSASFGVMMPGNMWFMNYPHKLPLIQERLDAQAKTTKKIAEAIEAKTLVRPEKSPTGSDDEKIYQDFNPYFMDKDFWTDDNCNGCEICSKICPADNIVIIDGKPVWQHQCEQCLACIHWCPQESIQFKDLTVNRTRYHHPDIKVQELFQE
jgi:flavodoxin/ferredoxin